ncbi:hypothetical protein GCM10027425_12230 [Alteromonas gracilis]
MRLPHDRADAALVVVRRARGVAVRRTTSWVLAGSAVTTGGLILGVPVTVAGVAGVLGVALAALGVRSWWHLSVAERRLGTEPEAVRAWAALRDNPAPHGVRPLLLVWEERPRAGTRPDRVLLADEDLDALLDPGPDVVLHEVWLDARPRPRFVVADRGVALPHRRSVLYGPRWAAGVGLTRRPREVAAPEPAAGSGPAGSGPAVSGLARGTALRTLALALLVGAIEVWA